MEIKNNIMSAILHKQTWNNVIPSKEGILYKRSYLWYKAKRNPVDLKLQYKIIDNLPGLDTRFRGYDVDVCLYARE